MALGSTASNRNEYQHLHVPIVLKSGSLNLLEPSRPVQVCNGIASPQALSVVCIVSNMAVYLQFRNFVLSWYVAQYRLSNFEIIYCVLLLLSSSLSPLCRVFIHIFLRQTMSLGNTAFQLFCHYYLWCLYR